jgi:gp16 family phage-associated protein
MYRMLYSYTRFKTSYPFRSPWSSPVTRSAAEARAEFKRRGASVAAWAVANGFSPQLVYRVLNGHAPERGQSHRIAVRLGLKEGSCGDIEGSNAGGSRLAQPLGEPP